MLEDPRKDLQRFDKYKELAADRDSEDGEALRKILSSHLSIYNALTNPELELSPRLGAGQDGRDETYALSKVSSANGPHDRTPPGTDKAGTDRAGTSGSNQTGNGSFYIDESWQAISNDSIIDPKIFEHPQNANQRILDPKIFRTLTNSPLVAQNARPSSLLSLTTDDDDMDGDRRRLTNSPADLGDPNSSAMVFETDEEDEEYTHLGSHDDNVFIMPKMSMSQEADKQLTVTLLSSCNVNYVNETNKLINAIKHELNDNINLIHLSLDKSKPIGNLNASLIRNSNLIFIVNDGSFIFIDQLKKVFKHESDDDEIPKVTVINMMTVNYFINLFELINNVKPYQIWKASSLGHKNLLTKFKQFIEFELDESCYSPDLATSDPYKGLSISIPHERSNSIYSSLISNKRPNYKLLEKRIKAELLGSSSSIDPLNLKKLSWLNAIYSMLSKAYYGAPVENRNTITDNESSTPTETSNSRVYLLASFTIGIALGIGLTTSFSKTVSAYLSHGIHNFSLLAKPEPEVIVKNVELDHSIITKISNQVLDVSAVCEENIKKLLSTEIVDEISNYIGHFLDNLKHTSSLMVNGVKGGFEKVLGFLSI